MIVVFRDGDIFCKAFAGAQSYHEWLRHSSQSYARVLLQKLCKKCPFPKKPFSNTKTIGFALNERISFLRIKIGRFSSQIPQLQLQFQNLLNHRPYTSLQSYIVLLPGGKGFYHLLLIQYRAGRKRVFPSGTNTIFCRFDIL